MPPRDTETVEFVKTMNGPTNGMSCEYKSLRMPQDNEQFITFASILPNIML